MEKQPTKEIQIIGQSCKGELEIKSRKIYKITPKRYYLDRNQFISKDEVEIID